MKHNIIQHTSFWDDKKHLPFDTRLMTLLLLTACGGGGSGGSGGSRNFEVSVQSTGQGYFIAPQDTEQPSSYEIDANSGDNQIVGGYGRGDINGRGGDDFITALGGTVTIDAGAGDDLVLLSSVKEATVTLGSGKDTLVIEDSGIGATYRIRDFNLQEDIIYFSQELSFDSSNFSDMSFSGAVEPNGDVSLLLSNDEKVIFEGISEDQAYDFLSEIFEQLFEDGDLTIGSSSNDEINGSERNDIISSFRGNDTINGFDGNDTISGHQGNDTINGGEGTDRLFGHEGDDIINGGAGSDLLFGMADNDELDGGSGNDHLYGGAGRDILIGGLGRDTLTGGAGVDILAFDYDEVSLVADIITDFEVGIDRLEFVEGFETDERYFDIVQSDGNTSIYYTQSGQREIIVTLEGVTDGVSFDDFLFYYAEVA